MSATNNLPTCFERPLPPGQVYPCTAEELAERLAGIPVEDRAGLWAVGLVPSTRRDCSANARYFDGARPVIHFYSCSETLRYKLPSHTRPSDVEAGMGMERAFGMQVDRTGARWWCSWTAEALRDFILEYVLLHEIGHHVLHRQRRADFLRNCPGTGACEQFAEAYARRHSPRFSPR